LKYLCARRASPREIINPAEHSSERFLGSTIPLNWISFAHENFETADFGGNETPQGLATSSISAPTTHIDFSSVTH
jgi:hypothetical protein